MLEQLLEVVSPILLEAAAIAAARRSEAHLEALQELWSDAFGRDPPTTGGHVATACDQYNLWRIVAGAADNIGTTATLNALEGLWLDPGFFTARLEIELSRIEDLRSSLARRDTDAARNAASRILVRWRSQPELPKDASQQNPPEPT